MSAWSHDSLRMTNGALAIKRPAGLTDYGWAKHAEAVCGLLNGAEGVAGPVAAPQGGNRAWRPWDGGAPGRERPTYPQAEVNYELRSGEVSGREAGGLRWDHRGCGSDIVAWRYKPGFWQKWPGPGAAQCPAGMEDRRVEVTLRNGSVLGTAMLGREWRWSHSGSGHDIIAWREAEA